MGMIKCGRHGFKGGPLACCHLQESVMSSHLDIDLIEIKIDVLDDGSELISHYFCQACASTNQFSNNQVLPSDAWSREVFTDMHPVCIDCWEEAKLQTAPELESAPG